MTELGLPAPLAYIPFDVADGALEVPDRLPRLALCLQAAVASDLALDLFVQAQVKENQQLCPIAGAPAGRRCS